ncbi:acyl-CoA-binding domain-containing protein 4-like [Lathyrus oleraceus]|uniref:acyl-CoA-binding domain-containing protein 4-like n=1 Tax=Pisum sativum TaxID=3888 RepID=UPI0021D10E47|nr:acyl-CoA-binding domain-containing protein 4-like [Pisum sativum]
MTWVSLINFKHEVFAEFKKFEIKTENQCGKKLKILRIDGEDEYNSTEFRKFCEENGIEHEVTTLYTPRHNGLDEVRNAKRTLLNDLHILDLETMTWDEIDVVGVPPSPRSDHAAAVHVERYLLIFRGGSHATCYNGLHVLDLQTTEWSRPTQQGEKPTPRAGHAGVIVGENWFIVGGDDKSGASETVVLNMSMLAWSAVTFVQGCVPVASEGLSLVVSSNDGEDVLVSFGGYNGRYNNEVYILKLSHKSTLQSKINENSIPDSGFAVPNATNATRESEPELGAD